MGVKLNKRLNKDGTTSLILVICHNKERQYEFLKLKLVKEVSKVEREQNKITLMEAEGIRGERERSIAYGEHDIKVDNRKVEVVKWMQHYIKHYTKKDKRSLQGALNRFSDFLIGKKKKALIFGDLNALLIEEFIDYLQSTSKGEGARSYFARFKKMIKQAYREDILKDNVIEKVEKKPKGKAKEKDILILEEIKILADTHTESTEVRRAFLFCCFTGLRFIDVNNLDWSNIDLKNRRLDIVQSKTEQDVKNRLNDTAIKLLGEQGTGKVFNLPSANGCNKALKNWVKRAGINKKITWHQSRHSFATNLIFNKVDVLVTSKMLGHTSLKHTMRYVRVAEEMKQKAADVLNIDI